MEKESSPAANNVACHRVFDVMLTSGTIFTSLTSAHVKLLIEDADTLKNIVTIQPLRLTDYNDVNQRVAEDLTIGVGTGFQINQTDIVIQKDDNSYHLALPKAFAGLDQNDRRVRTSLNLKTEAEYERFLSPYSPGILPDESSDAFNKQKQMLNTNSSIMMFGYLVDRPNMHLALKLYTQAQISDLTDIYPAGTTGAKIELAKQVGIKTTRKIIAGNKFPGLK